MSKLALLLATLAAAVSLAGCDSWLTKPSLYNTVEVIAARRNGAPVAGVAVELYTGARPMGYGVTDSLGRFTFTRVPQGSYGIQATNWPSDYDLLEHLVGGRSTNIVSGIEVAADSVAPTHLFFLKRGPGTVTVRVSDHGAPLRALLVRLYSPSATIDTARTDSLGRATFATVPYGQYGISVNRPFYYRDYVKPNDSLYVFRDGLVIEEGARDSVDVAITKCAGAVRISVLDETGSPVPATTAALYSVLGTFGVAQTVADGRLTFSNVPCAYSFGVAINPAPGYSANDARGSSFTDGLVVTNGQTVDAVLRVQRKR